MVFRRSPGALTTTRWTRRASGSGRTAAKEGRGRGGRGRGRGRGARDAADALLGLSSAERRSDLLNAASQTATATAESALVLLRTAEDGFCGHQESDPVLVERVVLPLRRREAPWVVEQEEEEEEEQQQQEEAAPASPLDVVETQLRRLHAALVCVDAAVRRLNDTTAMLTSLTC